MLVIAINHGAAALFVRLQRGQACKKNGVKNHPLGPPRQKIMAGFLPIFTTLVMAPL